MERIKLIVIICTCIFVRSGQSLTIEELSPLLETLKAGIRTEILSEITSITTEIGTNVLTIGEIVGVVQNQEEVIKQLTQELNETYIWSGMCRKKNKVNFFGFFPTFFMRYGWVGMRKCLLHV